ncbi:unnamed protein product [Effrenium voratum]|uniref:Uncharacterized protein n=1 Tax=Effrenium voratum TaxID=2562239 RepID=A0AA36JMF7_9DINO|nr:unnamed protein product [Effrenium voratum]
MGTTVCGVLPCDEPTVANSAISATDSLVKACAESNTARKITDSTYCTPQCDTGYVPRTSTGSAQLYCFESVLSPTTFVCELPAASVLSIFAPSRPKPEGAVDKMLQFAPGKSNDCVWSGYEFQGKQEVDGTTTDYGTMTGCEDSVWTSRDSVNCTAVELVEGGTYKFRVREICTDTNMNSPWTESESFTLRFVIPPDILLKLPTDDQFAAVSQALLAMQVDVHTTTDATKAFVVNRANIRVGGEVWCPTITWRVPANEILDGSPSGKSTVGLIQKRILIANFPDTDFIKPGCWYDIFCEAGLFVTEDTPSKVNPQFQWNFSYIDPSPVRKVLQMQGQEVKDDGIQVKFLVTYDLSSQINCTVAPVEPDAEPNRITGRVTSGAARPPIFASDVNRTLGEFLVFDDVAFEFTATGLTPSKKYTLNCAGWKRDKFWVPVVCSNFPESCPYISFTTLDDTRSDIKPLNILKTAVCADGTEATIASETQTFDQISTGIVMLLSQHERVCNNELVEGQVADTKVHFAITPLSDFATLTYTAPVTQSASSATYEAHTFSYDKQAESARLLMLTNSLDFTVCPHASTTSSTRRLTLASSTR